MALGTALVIGGLAARAIGSRRRRPADIRRAAAELRSARPTGYVTGEDLRASELTKGRIAADVRAQGELAGAEVARRYRARGLGGSPSEERTRGRVAQQTALGIQHAGETAEEQLYNVRMGREGFEREKELAIFGANVGEAARESQRQQAEYGAFWNSLNEFLPSILGYLPPSGGGAAGPLMFQPGYSWPTARGYNPSTR